MRAKVDRIKKSLVQILFFQIIENDKTRPFQVIMCIFCFNTILKMPADY